MLKGGKGNAAVGDGENPDQLEDVADDETDSSSVTAVHSDKEQEEKAKKAVEEAMSEDRRDPDARPPRSYQKVTIGIHNFGRWLGTPETIFAIRFSLVSVALWLPQIFRSSAQISYEQKLIWAQIMAQTYGFSLPTTSCPLADLCSLPRGLAVYSGDQILSTIQKLIGTACGLVWGMVIWYTGSESTDSSRYRVRADC